MAPAGSPLVRSLALTACIILVSPAVGKDAPAIDLEGTWPSAGEIEDVTAERVTFPSNSPFSLDDVGEEGVTGTTAEARLFLPEDASSEAPVPAVVLLHGASGVLSSRELTYGRQFASMGIAALVIDVFASRRELAVGFVDRLLNITESMMLADAFSGLDFLDSRPEVDGSRVVLMGFSYGGMAGLFAAHRQVAERYQPEGPWFAGHIVFYAPCIARFEDARATGAPLLMLAGKRDAIVDEVRCRAILDGLARGGAPVRFIVYPDAYHQWDGRFSQPRMIGRNLADCRFEVEEDGTVRDARTFIPMLGPLTRKVSLALCAAEEGYMIGRDDAVRAKSNRDVARFLEMVFDNSQTKR